LTAVASCEKQLEVLPNRADMTAAQKKTEEAKLLDALKVARKNLVDAMAAIRSASPAYRLMIAEDRKPIALEIIRGELVSEKTLALEYLIGEAVSYVLVYGLETEPKLLPLTLSEKQAELFGVEAGPLTSKKLESLLQNEKRNGVLQLITDMDRNGYLIHATDGGIPKTETQIKLAALWVMLVPDESIRMKMTYDNCFERLLILPDGVLAKLPFESLIVEPDTLSPQYLLDCSPPMVYAPSATVYYNLKQRKTEQGKSQVLTVGNPDYTAKLSTKSTDMLSEMRISRRVARIGTPAPLPWTENETRWVAESCEKNNIPVIRLDLAQSTEGNVRKNVTGRKIVHLACHGVAENDAGHAIFSTLLLTVGDPNDSKNDGFLELAEMFELDLKSCELAVLSACDTNLGPNQHGEGTWSMGRGMLASGAKRVVTTNWQIADDASAYLAYYFIDKVNGSPTPDIAAALHQAKKRIRNEPDEKKKYWQHPYYWAPFVLIGPN